MSLSHTREKECSHAGLAGSYKPIQCPCRHSGMNDSRQESDRTQRESERLLEKLKEARRFLVSVSWFQEDFKKGD